MTRYELYVPRNVVAAGQRLEVLRSKGELPRMDRYRRIRQVIAENDYARPAELVKGEIQGTVERLTGTVLAMEEDSVVTCYFLEEGKKPVELPFFYRDETSDFDPAKAKEGMALPGKEGLWHPRNSHILNGEIYYLMEQGQEDAAVFCVTDGKGKVLPVKAPRGEFDEEVRQALRKQADNDYRFISNIGLFASAKQKLDSDAEETAENAITGREECGERISVLAYLRQEQQKLRKIQKK